MPNFDQFAQFVMLDAVDLTLDRIAQRQHLAARIPALRKELAEANEYFRGVVVPPSVQAVADETWGSPYWDNWYFARAAKWVGDVQQRRIDAQRQLDELEYASDPATFAASAVLSIAHNYVRSLGLRITRARNMSEPQHQSGQPVAVIVWEARNQHEHWSDGNRLKAPCRACFKRLMAHDPIAFGLDRPPADDDAFDAATSQHSLAPEVLRTLGWTTATNAARGLYAIGAAT